MLHSLQLTDFKNFHNAELKLGPLTVVVGANAAGKSNIRDAFRFLHGVSRGYGLAEIIGEKYGDGGVLQWRGIRGGTREVCFNGATEFGIKAEFDVREDPFHFGWTYDIRVGFDEPGHQPVVVRESLSHLYEEVFTSHPGGSDPVAQQGHPDHLLVRMQRTRNQKKYGQRLELLNFKPGLVQIAESKRPERRQNREAAQSAISAFANMRFLDLAPDAMRIPSVPGQTIMGDRGENLSSVLFSICEDPKLKTTLIDWIRELTPMDAADFEFIPDTAGRILLTLVERSGQRISALSASDGTLRFLAMIAALLGSQAASFYFLEELDNGIHPARLNLLLQLIENQVATNPIQIVATTHSPDLMALLSDKALESASLVYRAESEPQGRIIRILDIPGAAEQVRKHRLGRLHASGWLEDAVAFANSDAA